MRRVTREEVLRYLPDFKNRFRVVNWGQSIKTIGNEILEAQQRFQPEYDNIYPLFYEGDIAETCHALWDFCKYELVYTKEDLSEQTVKSPAAILEPNERVDCKHYSLFIGGVLGAIQANENVTWEWWYWLVSDRPDKKIGHIFPAVLVGDREIWVDPVMSRFDEKENWTNYKAIEPMPVYELSGLSGTDDKSIEVLDKRVAETNFLVLVNMNAFSLKTILRSDRDVLYNQVKPWYEGQGYNFNQLLLILNQ